MDDNIKSEFKQKKINHIFHYTRRYDWLKKILDSGFAPSYCHENISEFEYFIPMVSFCNIPLKDVDNYMRYGKYGIGMSMEWAVRNSISPVIYIHEQTPFQNFYSLFSSYRKYDQTLSFQDMSIKVVQYFKNWKTQYRGNEIITYHEREWRYIPNLNGKKPIIKVDDHEFKDYQDKNKIKKPHFPEKALKINSISDLKYITVKDEKQRFEILDLLKLKFTDKSVTEALVGGQLLILTIDQLHNDF
ncbi:abortive infection system antitoxin AbiGi family protein [Carboxylicivirga sp. N1Y90]|uniref:abortive infection system antitoxin AbiGi family protein n=1 Tax=Carboxylicivirga fragile TaxID=3417571 RepID=UPI003D3543C7|nr:hypothetical protein [Marinilabiliaceae bacterium N1Y90]